VRRRDDCVQYEVRDEGIGIARADLELVFDKFYRAPDSGQHAISGTGLGLYIARELLRRLGGHLWVDSHLGQGSTFYVRVPMERA
jgi:signal transduction histidine kinase